MKSYSDNRENSFNLNEHYYLKYFQEVSLQPAKSELQEPMVSFIVLKRNFPEKSFFLFEWMYPEKNKVTVSNPVDTQSKVEHIYKIMEV